MHLHFVAPSDILKYLLISLNTLKDYSIGVARFNLCIPYLHNILLLESVLFDKIFIDLVELAVLASGDSGLRRQLIPLVNARLEPARF